MAFGASMTDEPQDVNLTINMEYPAGRTPEEQRRAFVASFVLNHEGDYYELAEKIVRLSKVLESGEMPPKLKVVK